MPRSRACNGRLRLGARPEQPDASEPRSDPVNHIVELLPWNLTLARSDQPHHLGRLIEAPERRTKGTTQFMLEAPL